MNDPNSVHSPPPIPNILKISKNPSLAWLAVVLILLIIGLQYRLWNGPGSAEEVTRLRVAIEDQTRQNQALRERNSGLAAEVRDLKSGLEAVEERARGELGMVRKDESFFLVVGK